MSAEKVDPKIKRVGGRREGSGRKKGTPNRITAEVKALAAEYAPAVLAELARIARESDSDAARVSAAREILDRACGKPSQAVTAEINGMVAAATAVDVSKLTQEQLLALASVRLPTDA